MSNHTNNFSANPSCLSLEVNFDVTGSVYIAHIITLITNALTALTAISGNLLILVAVLRTRSLRSPSNVLLCCLALSDLTVGLVAQPSFVVHKIGELTYNLRIYCITRVISETTGFITVGVSTLTLTAISMERYLALKLHLRYREVVTCRKVLGIAGGLWILLLILAGLRFLIINNFFNGIVVLILMMALLLTLWCYYRILKTVKRHENQVKVLPLKEEVLISETSLKVDVPLPRPSRRNIIKYKKSTIAMMYILGVFFACYLPILIVNIVILIQGYTRNNKIAYLYTSSLLLMNSSFNPVIYCWRMSDIRRAVKNTLRLVFPVGRVEDRSTMGSATIEPTPAVW